VDAKHSLNATSRQRRSNDRCFFALRGRLNVCLVDTTVANFDRYRSHHHQYREGYQWNDNRFGTFNINNATNIFNMSGGDIWIYDVCDATPPATAPYIFDVKSSSSNISVTA